MPVGNVQSDRMLHGDRDNVAVESVQDLVRVVKLGFLVYYLPKNRNIDIYEAPYRDDVTADDNTATDEEKEHLYKD